MIERGELDRDMSHDGATVTKTSVVAAIERRRGEPVNVSQLSQSVSRQPDGLDATAISLLLRRLEEQAAEIGQLRQISQRAESLQQDRDRMEAALHEERARAKTATEQADVLRKLAESSWWTRRKLHRL
jgi:predicted transcriptional regulator